MPWEAANNIEPIAGQTIGQIANLALYNTISGCAATYSAANMEKTIASGAVTHNGTTTAVAGNTVTLVSDPSDQRWTATFINSSGVAAIVSGDPSDTPSVPDWGDNVLNSLDLVQAGQTIAANITYQQDKRIARPVMGLVPQGQNNVEGTTTSTGDLVTVSGLSIATTKLIVVEYDYRKAAGAAADARFGLKVNSTEVFSSGLGPSCSSTNQAESGHARIILGPRDTATYLLNGESVYAASGAGGGTNAVNRLATAQPSATVTAIVATVTSNGSSLTVGVKNLRVWTQEIS